MTGMPSWLVVRPTSHGVYDAVGVDISLDVREDYCVYRLTCSTSRLFLHMPTASRSEPVDRPPRPPRSRDPWPATWLHSTFHLTFCRGTSAEILSLGEIKMAHLEPDWHPTRKSSY